MEYKVARTLSLLGTQKNALNEHGKASYRGSPLDGHLLRVEKSHCNKTTMGMCSLPQNTTEFGADDLSQPTLCNKMPQSSVTMQDSSSDTPNADELSSSVPTKCFWIPSRMTFFTKPEYHWVHCLDWDWHRAKESWVQKLLYHMPVQKGLEGIEINGILVIFRIAS